MWRTIAKLLWAFRFSEAVDESGHEIRMDPGAYTSGLTREPLPYRVKIEPRSPEHVATIRREFAEAGPFLRTFE